LTGPGAATDGKPRFDLSRFDPAYFGRLRDRVTAAGDKGIYVAVMLFEGFCLHLSPPPDNFVKQYEQQMGYDRHPVGMTMQYPAPDQRKVNDPLFNGPADWISPGFDDHVVTAQPGDAPSPGRGFTDPPANDGAKVVITDTDSARRSRRPALACCT